nr:UrcA family protein [Sphingomonas hankyongi]
MITAAAIKAAPAFSEPATPETNVSIVRTADLNLNDAAGQRALELRLVQAAREVCGTASDVDLHGKNAVRACRDDVLARAHEQRDAILASKDGNDSIRVAIAR